METSQDQVILIILKLAETFLSSFPRTLEVIQDEATENIMSSHSRVLMKCSENSLEVMIHLLSSLERIHSKISLIHLEDPADTDLVMDQLQAIIMILSLDITGLCLMILKTSTFCLEASWACQLAQEDQDPMPRTIVTILAHAPLTQLPHLTEEDSDPIFLLP